MPINQNAGIIIILTVKYAAHHIMEPHALLASTYTLWRKEIHPTLAARNQKLLKKQCCATQVRMKEIGIPIASNAIFAIRK